MFKAIYNTLILHMLYNICNNYLLNMPFAYHCPYIP